MSLECEQKGWDRGRWVGIYTQRVNKRVAVSGFGYNYPLVGHFSYTVSTNGPSKQSSYLIGPMQCSSLLELVNIA